MLLNKLRQWMRGRYGSDQLNMALLVLYLLLSIVTVPFRKWLVVDLLVMILSYAMLLVVLLRTFSRNIPKRYQENQRFLRVWHPFWGKVKTEWKYLKQRKDYHFYKCEKCGQRIRIPRGKGRICITCPRCKYEFVRKS